MRYDYRKLIGKITEVYGKQYVFAEAIGWSERTCSLKLTGRIEWKQTEIMTACKLLNIVETEICAYFFTVKVQ
jgi:hypothetical protein